MALPRHIYTNLFSELLMKMKFNFSPFYLLALILSVLLPAGCDGGNTSQAQEAVRSVMQPRTGIASPGADIDLTSILQTLDELAELERAGYWIQGMALTESSIRENTGDYAGAVAAAYKELAWAYGLGLIQKEELENGILNVLAVNNSETVYAAANAVLAFLRGQWDEAAAGLWLLFNHLELDEPDGFGRWMLLVCALETDNGDRRVGAAYRSIRARYTQFPEYWYRGARAFSGIIAAEFAENCINLSGQGPFANECRSILAVHAGLRIEDGPSIKTRREIDAIISQAVNTGSPQLLESLLPLISLSDNPYTTYVVGALRAIAGIPGFRDYFNAQAAAARGRLAERLSYISL
jgi:hypothetical protein